MIIFDSFGGFVFTKEIGIVAKDRVILITADLEAGQRASLFFQCAAACVKQVDDRFMAVGRNADMLAVSEQGRDHMRGRIGFSRSGRALNDKAVAVHLPGDPYGKIDRRLALLLRQAGRDFARKQRVCRRVQISVEMRSRNGGQRLLDRLLSNILQGH